MIFTALYEPFLAQIKVAFFTALFLAFPVISIQLWMFVAPGLYKNEKGAFLPFLVATPILFFMGGALVYYLIMPMAWEFFLNFQTVGGEGTLAIQVEPKVDQYLSLVLRLIFAFGIAFELPVLLILLAKAGIVTSAGTGGEAALCDCRRIYRRGDPDPAGRDQPDRAGNPDYHLVRDIYYRRPDDREETGQECGGRRPRRRPGRRSRRRWI